MPPEGLEVVKFDGIKQWMQGFKLSSTRRFVREQIPRHISHRKFGYLLVKCKYLNSIENNIRLTQ